MKIEPLKGSEILYVHGVGSNFFKFTDILFAESLAHESKPNFIRLHLINGKSIETYGSLQELENSSSDFIKANRRQAFNIIHCDRIEGNTLILKQNKQIEFSRRELQNFKKTMGKRTVVTKTKGK